MATKIYVAAPLFNIMEIERNKFYAKKLAHAGFDVFLPQRDAGEIAAGAHPIDCFNKDVAAIDACDWLLALCDGRTQDEGTCWEMGYAWAKQKHIIIIHGDKRWFSDKMPLNNMLGGCAALVCQNLEDAIGCLKSYSRMPD